MQLLKPNLTSMDPDSPNNHGKPGPVFRIGSFSISEQERIISLCTLLFLLTLIAFRPALNNGFVTYDDPDYVTSNSQVQQGLTWESIKWAFQPNRETANWHPLTWLSHMMDCQLFGLNPWGHHLTSVLIHGANTVLLFLVLIKMFRAVFHSFLVAALFGLHPLHVQSVAWVAERKDVLSTLFWLLTLWAYNAFVRESVSRRRKFLNYTVALIFFLLGLMCKPMLVTLPFLLLLLDCWPLQRVAQKHFMPLIVEKIPFVLLAAASSVLTFIVQKNAGAVVSTAPLPLTARLENVFVAYERYLGKIFLPANLSVFYPHPVHWPVMLVALAIFLFIVLTVLAVALRRNCPYLLFGWLWFVGTLVPVIGLVQVGSQSMADRYSYVPAIGIFILAVWGTHQLTARLPYRTIVLSAASAVLICSCVAATRKEVRYWQNSGTLFRRAIAVTANNYLAYQHLGYYLKDQGLLDEAIKTYGRAIEIHPDWPDAYIDLGDAYLQQNRLDDAVRQFEKAIQLKPGNARAHNLLGLAWMKKDRFDEATSELQQSIRLDPADPEAHNNLGVVLGKSGRTDAAIAELEKAIALKRDYARAHGNLGIVFATNGRREEAIAQLTQALKLQPNYPEVQKQLNELMATVSDPKK